jgi:GDP-D-mannose dehydratase
MKTAFVTGITGQDGFHLTKLLISKNYSIFGLVKVYNSLALECVDSSTVSAFQSHITTVLKQKCKANEHNWRLTLSAIGRCVTNLES